MNNSFFIIGNGGCGTSLLRGLLNAHSQMEVAFELWNPKQGDKVEGNLKNWQELAEEKKQQGILWGDKIPLEQFVTLGWTDEDILKISDYFKIIWITRRYSKYFKKPTRNTNKRLMYEKNWQRSNELYWKFREKDPACILQVAYEDLLLHTWIELLRCCIFIGVGYEPFMIEGTNETGHPTHNYDRILIEKL